MSRPTPKCPIRPGEPCTLCQMGVSGPEDCQTVKLVMEDDDLRELLAVKRREYRDRVGRRTRRAPSSRENRE